MTLILSGTDGLSDVDGSAATPAIRGTDANTGIFFPAADQVAITTGGTQRAVVDASGNVGIGTASPASDARLTLASPTTESYVMFSRTNSTFFDAAVGNNAGSLVFKGGADSATVAGLTEFMRIDSSGNVGIGTASPATKLQVNGSIAIPSSYNLSWGGAYGAGIPTITADGTNGVQFYPNGSTSGEKIRIDTSGNLLVAKTSTSAGVVGGAFLTAGDSYSSMASSSNTTSTLNVYSTTLSQYQFYVGMAGTVYARTTTISGLSDARLKENIRDLDDGLNTVMALKPRLYDWKEGKGADIKNARGFIAQEFEEVFPDLIDEWKDPAPEGEEPYKSVRQDLIPVLVKAIQELKALVDTQASTITALQADVEALKGTP